MNAFLRFLNPAKTGVLFLSLLLLFACTEKTYVTNPIDQRPPRVEWVSIGSGADLNPPYYAVHDTVALTISATDESGVDSLKLYINGFPRFSSSSSSSSFSFLWNTLSDSDGVYSLEARAWDKAGNVGETPTLLVRVSNTTPPPPPDRTPPVIRWLSPEPGSTVRDTFDLVFEVADSSHLDSILVFVDGEVARIIAESDNSNYIVSMNSWRWSNGLRILEVRAYDAAGNVGIGNPVGLTIDNHRVLWVPDDYETIQGAINASVDGDTVRVRDGVYPGEIDLLRKRIWLESENGPDFTIIDAFDDGYGMIVFGGQDTSLMIRGFKIQSAIGYGIAFNDASSASFCNNIVVRSGFANLWALQNQCIITNNVFADNNPDRVNVQLRDSNGRFENNMLIRSGDFALWNISITENPLIPEYNLFWQYDYLTDDNPGFRLADNNLIDVDPMLSDTLFHLLPQSPCIDAGDPNFRDPDGTRSDIGAYGGPHAYR